MELALNSWLSLTFKALALGVEAQSVMAMRVMRLAAGGARAHSEARRMVAEKVAAAAEMQAAATAAIMMGRKDHVVAGKALRAVGKRVRANRRRLLRR